MKWTVECTGTFVEERVVEADSAEEAAREAVEGQYGRVLSTTPVEPLEVTNVTKSPELQRKGG